MSSKSETHPTENNSKKHKRQESIQMSAEKKEKKTTVTGDEVMGVLRSTFVNEDNVAAVIHDRWNQVALHLRDTNEWAKIAEIAKKIAALGVNAVRIIVPVDKGIGMFVGQVTSVVYNARRFFIETMENKKGGSVKDGVPEQLMYFLWTKNDDVLASIQPPKTACGGAVVLTTDNTGIHLFRKRKKLTGAGGCIDQTETPVGAIEREFAEELKLVESKDARFLNIDDMDGALLTKEEAIKKRAQLVEDTKAIATMNEYGQSYSHLLGSSDPGAPFDKELVKEEEIRLGDQYIAKSDREPGLPKRKKVGGEGSYHEGEVVYDTHYTFIKFDRNSYEGDGKELGDGFWVEIGTMIIASALYAASKENEAVKETSAFKRFQPFIDGCFSDLLRAVYNTANGTSRVVQMDKGKTIF